MRLLGSVTAALLLLALAAPAAVAHVSLAATEPAADAAVDAPPPVVRLIFDGALQAAGDHAIGVFAADGSRLDEGDVREAGEGVLEVSVTPPPVQGPVQVRWLIVAGDGDTQEGEFSFDYAGPLDAAQPLPASPSADPDAADEPSPSEEPAPTPTASAAAPSPSAEDTPTAEDGGLPSAAWIGIGLAVVLGGGGVLLATRGGRRG